MRKLTILAAALAAFASLVAAASAAEPAPPTVTPFPAPKLGPVFVAAQTVDKTGAMQAQFAPGSSVIFRAYAVDSKTKKIVKALQDETGGQVQSEKLLEIVVDNGKVVRAANQFGVGQKQ